LVPAVGVQGLIVSKADIEHLSSTRVSNKWIPGWWGDGDPGDKEPVQSSETALVRIGLTLASI